MTTGIQANGTDLDSLFLPLEGTKRADVNIDSNGGVDISNRFEPIGDGTPIANTGIQSGGVDIATLFRDINEPVQGVGEDWPYAGGLLSFNFAPADSAAYFEFRSSGQFDARDDTSEFNLDFLKITGAGEANNFYVKWVLNSGDAPNFGNMPTQDTYYQMNVTRQIGFEVTGLGDFNANITVTIAEDASGTGAVSSTNNFSCGVEP